jgi:phage terminase Nu1 subunit (DNA packaging protein)
MIARGFVGSKPLSNSLHAEATKQRGRLVAAQADLAEFEAAQLRGELVEAGAVEIEWSGVLRTIRAGMLVVPSRLAARLPNLKHDLAEVDRKIRQALLEMGSSDRALEPYETQINELFLYKRLSTVHSNCRRS